MGRVERFDHVIVATHADQALALLSEPSAQEQQVLGAIRYQPNEAVLHTDVSALPSRPSTWAAWNYERAASPDRESRQVCLHYLINQLQPLPVSQPVIVSLNPLRPIAPASILGRYDYAHPVFDVPAIAAQKRVAELQGRHNTWFAGAWTGYGFHEDGLKSGLAVARQWLQQQHSNRAGAPS
jgi:predicted NAD/FAD-binding protein